MLFLEQGHLSCPLTQETSLAGLHIGAAIAPGSATSSAGSGLCTFHELGQVRGSLGLHSHTHDR